MALAAAPSIPGSGRIGYPHGHRPMLYVRLAAVPSGMSFGADEEICGPI
jgi:hypothetical protein